MPESVDGIRSQEDSLGIDTRSPEVRRLDYMADMVADLSASVKKVIDHFPVGNTQTVIHKTQGMGVVGVICATICTMCMLFLILGAIVFVPDIHDLKAWQDILRRDVARLQAQSQPENRK